MGEDEIKRASERSRIVNNNDKEQLRKNIVKYETEKKKKKDEAEVLLKKKEILPYHIKKKISIEEEPQHIRDIEQNTGNNKYAYKGSPKETDDTEEKLLILNKHHAQEKKTNEQKEKGKIKEKEQIIKNGYENNFKSIAENNNRTLRNYNKRNKIEENDENDDAQYEIPVKRKRTTTKTNSYKDAFMKRNQNIGLENYGDKTRNIFDFFNLHDFPMYLLEKRNELENKQKGKKYVVQFLDTFNDDFVKKNMNNNVIFEAIDVCKGVSYLNVEKNISINCLGWKDSAFYLYKMIPLRKIYSTEAIQKIMKKDPEETKTQKKVLENSYENAEIDAATGKNKNSIFNNVLFWKRFFKSDKDKHIKHSAENDIEKEKEKFYNDLYLMPYEKNLKSSICLGTHIYSKERAVKKCFGVSIERNVITGDFVNEDNNNVQNNLENLYYDLPHNQNNIMFQPVPYAYKNKKIVAASFHSWLKNVKWDNWSYLKDKEFYSHIRKDIFNFAKDVYYTTKHSINYFDSSKDFLMQTTQRMKDINVKMKQICERSFDIAQNLVLKLSKASKAS